MHSTTDRFKENARDALADTGLQKALTRASAGFVDRRTAVIERLPEFDTLRDEARVIKDHTIANLDFYLERFESKVAENGGPFIGAAPPTTPAKRCSISAVWSAQRPSPRARP